MTAPQRLVTILAALALVLSLVHLYAFAPSWGYGMPQGVRLGTLGAGLVGILSLVTLLRRAAWVLRRQT